MSSEAANVTDTIVRRQPGGRAFVEFERVYRANVGAVTAYFARRCSEPQDVADLTSETVLEAAGSLLLSATASPPAFAVTRLQDGSVSVKINRTSSIADVNRKLAAMGIQEIEKRAMVASDASSSIPSCSSIPPGWKGEWVQSPGCRRRTTPGRVRGQPRLGRQLRPGHLAPGHLHPRTSWVTPARATPPPVVRARGS